MRLKLPQLLAVLRFPRDWPRRPKPSGCVSGEAVKEIEAVIQAAREYRREKQRVRICMSVNAMQDGILRNRIASLAKREVRKLGDTDFVDSTADNGVYELRVIAVQSDAGETVGSMAVSLVLNRRMVCRNEKGGVSASVLDHECSYLFQCDRDQLECHVENAVSCFDEESFDRARRNGRADAGWIREYIECLGVHLREIKEGSYRPDPG